MADEQRAQLTSGGAFFHKESELLNMNTPCFIADITADGNLEAKACLSQRRQWTVPIAGISRVEVKRTFVDRGVSKTPIGGCPWQMGGGNAIIDMDAALPAGWLNSVMGSNGGKYHVGLKVSDAGAWLAALQNAGAKGIVAQGSAPTAVEMAR